MRPWVRWSSGVVCAGLAIGIAQAQNSAFGDGTSRAHATAIAQERLASFLVEPLPSHAVPQDRPSSYKPDTLYQYIDGGADIYLLYEFRSLLHQDFKSGAVELTADIYDMGNPEDAFGMYAAERSPGYKFMAIGVEGYRSEGILNFLQDHYYVKLAGSGPNANALLDQFAHTLSGRIGGARTLPALLEKLPIENRVKHSEQYMRRDPLGHAFLAPAYVVAYARGRQQSKLLISVANDAAGSRTRLQQLAQHFKQSGECVAAPQLGEGGIRAKNDFEGRVIARTQGRYLILLLEPPENGAEILKKTAQSLP
jgi:hypothetical protein